LLPCGSIIRDAKVLQIFVLQDWCQRFFSTMGCGNQRLVFGDWCLVVVVDKFLCQGCRRMKNNLYLCFLRRSCAVAINN
jgi:hypothetical protein